jgi:hypothetical protein
MPDLLEIARQALDDLQALIPEDKRAEAQSKYSRAQDQMRSAMTDLTAEQEEAKQQLEGWRTNLSRWKGEQEQALTERARQIAEKERALGRSPVTDPPVVPPGTPSAGLSREDIAPLFDDFGRAVVGATSEVFRLQHRYSTLYPGQEFNPETLFAHPLAKTHGLSAAFNELHKEKITASVAAQQEAAEKKIREDERQKVLAEFRGQSTTLPFPGPGDDDSPFGMLQRRQADNQERFGAEAAAEEFNRLRLTRPA